ncbi:hypothetical protein AAY473_008972 [Plecturocebus cupreus]
MSEERSAARAHPQEMHTQQQGCTWGLELTVARIQRRSIPSGKSPLTSPTKATRTSLPVLTTISLVQASAPELDRAPSVPQKPRGQVHRLGSPRAGPSICSASDEGLLVASSRGRSKRASEWVYETEIGREPRLAFFFFETGSSPVTQAAMCGTIMAHCSFYLLGSSDPPTSQSPE